MENKIANNVLEQIKTGQVKMHSRGYFVTRTAASILLVSLTALLAWFLFSLIFFILIRHGALYLPFFGLAGLWALLTSFPWFVFGLGVIFFILLDKLVNNFSVAYRRPVLYTVLAVAALLVLGLGLAHATGLNSQLHQFIKDANLPGLRRLYDASEDRLARTLFWGRVDEIEDDNLVITTGEGQRQVLKIQPNTRYSDEPVINKGETVIIGARQNRGQLEVYGIKKIKRPSVKIPANRNNQSIK